MINKLVEFILTGFYSGKLKYMPGTFGTVFGIIIYIGIANNNLQDNIFLLLILFFFSLILLDYSYKKNIVAATIAIETSQKLVPAKSKGLR